MHLLRLLYARCAAAQPWLLCPSLQLDTIETVKDFSLRQFPQMSGLTTDDVCTTLTAWLKVGSHAAEIDLACRGQYIT